MGEQPRYEERISSNRTEGLFVVLMLLCAGLGAWRVRAAGFDVMAAVLSGLALFFLFYALNYRVLIIRLAPEALELRFGLFTWKMAVENIEACFPDETSLWRIGGAGIHFSPIGGRYRAMFNFLEYPRLVVALKQKKGPVRDVAFSTQRPDEVLRLIQEATAAKRDA